MAEEDNESDRAFGEHVADMTLRLANCRALLTRAEDLLRGTPEVNRTRAQKDLLFDIEAMKGRC